MWESVNRFVARTKPRPRTPVGLARTGDGEIAVACDDGTVWCRRVTDNWDSGWEELPPIPESRVVP